MQRGYKKFIEVIHFSGDMVLLNFSFFMAYLIKIPVSPWVRVSDHYLFLFLLINLAWMLISGVSKLYDIPRFSNMEGVWRKTLNSILIHALITLSFIFLVKGFYYSRGLLLYGYILLVFLILLWRSVFLGLLKRYRKSGYNFKRIVIVGAGTIGNQLYNYFNSDLSLGYRFEGFFHNKPEQCLHREMVRGSIDDVDTYIKSKSIDEIYCTLPLTQTQQIRKLMSLADNNLIRFKMVPDFRAIMNRKVDLSFYYDTPILTVRQEPLENYFNSLLKRSFDIFFSLILILFLFPILFPIVIAAIKLSSPGPVFFIQQRSGRNNAIFTCYKFRTMVINQAADNAQAVKDDPRVTRVGSFLRKTNIDELPQFFNVLLGHMSVVGPRPHMLSHTEKYSRIIDRFLVRHFVKPGITGWAQVNGFRGPLDPKMMYRRVKFDVWYLENWSLILDIKIIFRTVRNMLTGERNAF